MGLTIKSPTLSGVRLTQRRPEPLPKVNNGSKGDFVHWCTLNPSRHSTIEPTALGVEKFLRPIKGKGLHVSRKISIIDPGRQ